MKRRTWYLLSLALFVPLILWYAGQFSDLPEMTFAEAGLEEDHTKRVMVSGQLVPDAGIKGGEGSVTFFLQDTEGKKERIVYEGTDEYSPESLKSAEEVSVVGHMCSDGEGPRFHAKGIYLTD